MSINLEKRITELEGRIAKVDEAKTNAIEQTVRAISKELGLLGNRIKKLEEKVSG